MNKKIIHKVPGGKLVKIFLETSEKKICRIMITGDFFMHPEESVEELEKNLIGLELDEEKLLRKIKAFFKEKKVRAFGITPEELAKAITQEVS